MTLVDEKLANLKKILQTMRTVLVAYSGGVDSTFLAAVAYEVLADRMLAVFASSEVSPPSEKEEAEKIAKEIGFRLMIIESSEMADPNFISNPPDRCYYCRRGLFKTLQQVGAKENLMWIADGTNTDDLSDYRPGRKATIEMGIRSPLLEAGLTKQEIRELSQSKNLPTWNKPASPCLASRIPYGTPVTGDILSKIATGEKFLHSLGLDQVRLRHHYNIARIEIREKDMAFAIKEDIRRQIVTVMKNLGYQYITIDLTGYRTGSLNLTIKETDGQNK
jgi:pyridinium-3,5-biscarboxylic acid mononucleotide sulfurtransferase